MLNNRGISIAPKRIRERQKRRDRDQQHKHPIIDAQATDCQRLPFKPPLCSVSINPPNAEPRARGANKLQTWQTLVDRAGRIGASKTTPQAIAKREPPAREAHFVAPSPSSLSVAGNMPRQPRALPGARLEANLMHSAASTILRVCPKG